MSEVARPRGSLWHVVLTAGRIVTSTILLFAIFALTPLEMPDDGSAFGRLLLSLLLLAAIVTLQIITVARSPRPMLRAIEALSVSFTLLILLFASTYAAMAKAQPDSFNESLSRVDAVYLTVTVFATVGFGDLVADSQAARVVVTVQMVVNTILIGIVARVLLGTVQQRRAVLREQQPGHAVGGDERSR